MKKSFKLLIGATIFAALLSLSTTLVQAQGAPNPVIVGVPLQKAISSLIVTQATTVSSAAIVNIQGSKYCGVQVVSKSDVANTSNTVVVIDRSIDGVNYVTGYSTITLANTGTTTANCISNYSPLSDCWWRFSVQNTATNAGALVTNTVSVFLNRVQ